MLIAIYYIVIITILTVYERKQISQTIKRDVIPNKYYAGDTWMHNAMTTTQIGGKTTDAANYQQSNGMYEKKI